MARVLGVAKNIARRTLKARRFLRTRIPSARLAATVERRGEVEEIRVGDKSFTISSSFSLPGRDTVDYALFGLAAVSMTSNVEIEVGEPVSTSAAERMRKLRDTYFLWSIPHLAPLRLVLKNVVPDPPAASGGRVLCLSGGLDSTAAAVEAISNPEFTHGLLIAGADYPDARSPGFVDLRRRVQAMADRLGFGLIVVETDFRRLRYNWTMLHSFNLAMCLHFHAPAFRGGAIGADLPLEADYLRHPWGNSHALGNLFGTTSFGLEMFNRTTGRTEKVREIASFDPELLKQLSVCWHDASYASNCGRCAKCTQTRLNFFAAGVDHAGIFTENPPLIDLVRSMEQPVWFSELRGALAQMTNILVNLPDGEVRDALGAFVDKLRLKYIRGMPHP